MKIFKNNRGQGMTEYIIIMAAVVALAVTLVSKFRAPINANIDKISTDLSSPGK